ncbi:hypothetical protein AB0I68_38585 [Streptomyces sp. NPDC050448]|uniref:hypothetical protein n=1 Tax=Streptomyces sp. NPDC050448 TaxID=3155404 RepID=UPI00343234C0
MAGGLERMEPEWFDLSRLTMKAATSAAHPDGVCTTEHMACSGCHMLAPIATRFGGPMAHCRLCGYAWAVTHHPAQCWQRISICGGPTAEQVRQATPDLVAARSVLDGIVGSL